MAALGHVLAASVKTVAAVKPTTYKLRIADPVRQRLLKLVWQRKTRTHTRLRSSGIGADAPPTNSESLVSGKMARRFQLRVDQNTKIQYDNSSQRVGERSPDRFHGVNSASFNLPCTD
jgi:hypothetical protein